MSGQTLHVVVPATVDDPRVPSGGNVYDRELVTALRAGGTTVTEHHDVGEVPDGAAVVVDGLIGLADPHALERELRVVLLVHLPLSLAAPGEPGVAERERRALARADAVVTTSAWTRDWLLAHQDLRPSQVVVARPGVRRAPLTAADDAGTRLLTVGAVRPAKGHDVLVAALSRHRERPWTWTVAGSLEVDSIFCADLSGRVAAAGLGDRVRLLGPLGRPEMTAAYAAADLVVLPTRLETYGMAVTEALAHGVPVLATGTGGVPEALHTTRLGRPGVLVPPGDDRALHAALDRWWSDGEHRSRLRAAAAVRRQHLDGWDPTAAAVLHAVNQSGADHVVSA